MSSASATDNRLTLENLMTEFFSSGTGNARKAEIETMLNHFTAQKDSWRPSLEFLAGTQNHYVAMFALSTIEVIIRKKKLKKNYFVGKNCSIEVIIRKKM